LDDSGEFDRHAATDFSSALFTLCGDSEESWFSRWLHPSAAARVMLLKRIALRPEIALQLRRRTNAIAAILVLLYIAAAALAFPIA
jgi:hypothetical protein